MIQLQQQVQMKRQGTILKDNFIRKKIPIQKNDLSKQQQISKLVRQANRTNQIKLYKKLKYKNSIYTVGDTLNLFNDKGQYQPYVAKLIRIIKLQDQIQKLPFIQVQWYYRSKDLPKNIAGVDYSCFSVSEVFQTQHKDYVHIESIMRQCKILSQQQYQKLEEAPPHLYFTRASYNYKKKQLTPQFQKWKKSCICNLPLNPDLQYIQCDICQRWFHLHCLNVSIQTARNLLGYVCKKCDFAN